MIHFFFLATRTIYAAGTSPTVCVYIDLRANNYLRLRQSSLQTRYLGQIRPDTNRIGSVDNTPDRLSAMATAAVPLNKWEAAIQAETAGRDEAVLGAPEA